MGEGLDLASIIDDNETYSLMNSSIKDALKTAFQDALDYTQVFNRYIEMYLENMELSKFF